jgi:hypothetical protein
MTDTTTGAFGRKDPIPTGLMKLTALAGAGFGLLFFLAFIFGGDETPDTDAPVGDWSKYAVDNQDDLRLSTLFVGLAVYALIWFASYLRMEFGAAEESDRGFTGAAHAILAGAIVGGVGLAVAIGLAAGATADAESTPPEVIRGISRAADNAWILVSAGFAAHMIGSGVLILRLKALFPVWLGWVATIGGACFLLQLLVLLSDDEDNFFGFAYPVAFLLLLVWTIGSSVLLFLRLNRTTVAAPGAPTPTAV